MESIQDRERRARVTEEQAALIERRNGIHVKIDGAENYRINPDGFLDPVLDLKIEYGHHIDADSMPTSTARHYGGLTDTVSIWPIIGRHRGTPTGLEEYTAGFRDALNRAHAPGGLTQQNYSACVLALNTLTGFRREHNLKALDGRYVLLLHAWGCELSRRKMA